MIAIALILAAALAQGAPQIPVESPWHKAVFLADGCAGNGIRWEYDEPPLHIFYEGTENGLGVGFPIYEKFLLVGCGHDGSTFCFRAVESGPPPVFTPYWCVEWEDMNERFLDIGTCPHRELRAGRNCPGVCYFPVKNKRWCSGPLGVRNLGLP